MAHPPVCPCPNCRGSGGWGWLLLVAAFAVIAVACCFAVHAAVAWLAAHVVFDVLAGWLLGFGGFGVACKARERGRRGLPDSARAMSQVPPAPAATTELLRVPRQRDGGGR